MITLKTLSILKDFKCLGSDCEHTCCIGQHVHFETDFVQNPLLEAATRSKLDGLEQDGCGGCFSDGKACPFLSSDRLCNIQIKHGHELLPQGCQDYPRQEILSNGEIHQFGLLSCPEITNLVILGNDLLQFDGDGQDQSNDDGSGDIFYRSLGVVQKLMISVVARTNQTYLGLYRLFVFTERLQTEIRFGMSSFDQKEIYATYKSLKEVDLPLRSPQQGNTFLCSLLIPVLERATKRENELHKQILERDHLSLFVWEFRQEERSRSKKFPDIQSRWLRRYIEYSILSTPLVDSFIRTEITNIHEYSEVIFTKLLAIRMLLYFLPASNASEFEASVKRATYLMHRVFDHNATILQGLLEEYRKNKSPSNLLYTIQS